jgi:hypothetical protein
MADNGKWWARPLLKEQIMSSGRKMLLESLAGHLALLESAYPRKASSLVARKARRYVRLSLRKCETQGKRVAA